MEGRRGAATRAGGREGRSLQLGCCRHEGWRKGGKELAIRLLAGVSADAGLPQTHLPNGWCARETRMRGLAHKEGAERGLAKVEKELATRLQAGLPKAHLPNGRCASVRSSTCMPPPPSTYRLASGGPWTSRRYESVQ
eukprot:357881-Chlamydomonas_euryale.AAC.4